MNSKTKRFLVVIIAGICLLGGTQYTAPKSDEYNALEALYNSAGGENWTNKDGWLTGKTPCEWAGVTCTDGQVTDLALAENRLSGTIPPELGNLTELKRLDLRGNQLSGSIPPELGTLTGLTELILWGNQLSGNIPPELGSLSNLRNLTLAANRLSGSIPPELGNLASLNWLNLDDNQLSGSIPPELGNLSNLTILSLPGNQLSSSIPPELGNLTNLTNLWLYRNQLSGSIPPELSSLTNVLELSLHSNQLSGSIPPKLGNLSSVKNLSLFNNHLSGEIPPELSGLADLSLLHLHKNQLSGSLPANLVNLTALRDFNFADTNLCEPVDEAFQTWLSGIAHVSSTGITCAEMKHDPVSGIDFVWVAEGCFQMGSPDSEAERSFHEGPVHEICVDGFWMGKYEVTQAQWQSVMGSNPSNFKGDLHPVEMVSWNEAQEFLQTLNAAAGKEMYRLPTEAEWEYAARAGTTTTFSFGNTISTDLANYDGENYTYDSGAKGIYRERSTEVGSFPPNDWGLYDMHGNASEWCQDWYDGEYYSKSPRENPQGPSSGIYRVVRGGSWGGSPRYCRSADRARFDPDDSYFGFRVVVGSAAWTLE